MNFYVYSEDEISGAIRAVMKHLEDIGMADQFSFATDKCEAPDISYNWYNLFGLIAGDFHHFNVTYPSGAAWNRKVHELLFKEMFPPVKPIQADYFLVPLTIIYGDPFTPKQTKKDFDELIISRLCSHLLYWQHHKGKHVFFITGDSHDQVDVLRDSIVFRPSCHKDSNDHVLYYDVILDMSEVRPIEYCTNRCAFVGCLETHPLRRTLPIAIDKVGGNKIFESTPNFFNLLPRRTQENMQLRWIEALNSSEFIIAPRGCGLTSIRFFEALAFGRIPVLIADDTKLPITDRLNYDDFVVRVPEGEIENLADFIEDFRATHDLQKSSKLARDAWEEYLSGGKLRRYLELSLPPALTVNKHKVF